MNNIHSEVLVGMLHSVPDLAESEKDALKAAITALQTPAPVAAGELERGVRLALQSFKDLEERGGGTMPGTVKTLQDILARATPGADGGADTAIVDFLAKQFSGMKWADTGLHNCRPDDEKYVGSERSFRQAMLAAMNPTASADHTKG